jgi:hypothetical protein
MIAPVLLPSACFALGIFGIVASTASSSVSRKGAVGRLRLTLTSAGRWRSAVVALVTGVVVAGLTGRPALFPIVALGVYGLPKLFGQTSSSVSIAKIEAIASWTEMLQGALAAASGLSQAIVTTGSLGSAPIRRATVSLSSRMAAGMDPREALLLFGDELNDPCADRVICSLLLAMSSRGQRLGDLLATLADSTRDEVALRLRIETSRASVRSGVRTVLVFTVGFALAIACLAHAYLAPFGTPTGQMVLLVVGMFYAVGLTCMVSLSRPPAPVRLLGTGVVDR